MKMRITVNIENDDNTEAVESTAIELGIPNFDAFTGPDTFGEIFDRYERKALEARNDAMKAATEKYLSELAKKTPSETEGEKGKIIEKPNHYAIDAEIGLVEIHTYELKKGHKEYLAHKEMFFQKQAQESITKPCVFRNSRSFIPVMSPTEKVPGRSTVPCGEKKGRRCKPARWRTL